MIEARSSFVYIKRCLEKAFVKYHCRARQKSFTFSQIEKQTIYDKERIVYQEKVDNILE